MLLAVAGHLAGLAEADPDREVCGLVVAPGGGAAEAWPLPNVAPDPSRAFLVPPEALLLAFRRLDAGGGALLAVYHSHLSGGAALSASDLEVALAGGEPVLPGVAQVVVALEKGRAVRVRAHRFRTGRFEGLDLWPTGGREG